MTYRLGTPARNAACDAIVDLLDVGGAGSLKIYTNAQPGSVGGSEAGNTLLGTLGLSATAFGSASTGVATSAAISSDTSADASGTAGHFIFVTGGGTTHSDGTCGTGTGDLSFDNAVIVAGGTIAIGLGNFTVTVPIQ